MALTKNSLSVISPRVGCWLGCGSAPAAVPMIDGRRGRGFEREDVVRDGIEDASKAASVQFEEEDGSDNWARREGILYLRREA